ncbi:hypothetical protein CTAYLR_004309 [Chrysophaeum taylorii]|uniref:Enoyl reductase (ER) domain-containing protein n=1 Tax=Chrysophaeum taylorii TaxID=2483200 RepID=A0AAD7UHZ3_9STRA|nr:hypothetical protein CTAYLR_004309 [Chrysophaeum taylorii]
METPGAFGDARKCKCYAAKAASEPLEAWEIERRGVGARDVGIDIRWSGICHSDIHCARNEWFQGLFPLVPGHEIAGVVAAVGPEVTKFKAGDKVGVGVFVDSCRECDKCRQGREQYCLKGKVGTYGAKFPYPHCAEMGATTYGGYSQYIVCDESYALRIPDNLDLAASAPLLCAGITTWSPLMFYGAQANSKVAVAGLGGLGHMAVKFAVALGAHTTVLSRSEVKREEALGLLGAHAFVNTKTAKAEPDSFDLIIDTISADHDLDALLSLVKPDGGNLCLVGLPPDKISVKPFSFVGQRKILSGSCIGGIKETQDMLDFCGRHNITCLVEKINARQINMAFDRAVDSDVKYRFVIDASSF